MLRRVAVGDRAAFDALYRASSAKLFGVALRVVGRRDLADEALQDSFVKIWNRAGDFDASRGSPITWMATIVRNRALDEVRRKSAIPMGDMPEGFDPADEIRDPLAGRERSEGLVRLLTCLKSLDVKQRNLILLAYYHGASRDDLAKRFDAPISTIKTWLRRNLAQLRECLST